MTFKSHLSRSAFNLFPLLLIALIFSIQHASAKHHQDNRPCYVCTYDARVYNADNAQNTADHYCRTEAIKGPGMTGCDYQTFDIAQDDPNPDIKGKLTKCKFKCAATPTICGVILSRQRIDGTIDRGVAPSHGTWWHGHYSPEKMPGCEYWPGPA